MIGAAIAGRPVQLFDWQAEVATGYGDRVLTGRVSRDVRWAEQGAPVELWRRAGDPLWVGALVEDPRDDGDWLSLRAEGEARRLETIPLLYRHDGAEGFVERDSEPHEYTGQSQAYDIHVGKGKLRWVWGDGNEAFVTGQDAGAVFWPEGCLITRYSVRAERNIAISSFDLVVRRFTGPTGTRTLVQTHNLTPGTADTFANNITTPEDGLEFAVNANDNTTPAGRRGLNLTRIMLYGRTTDDAFRVSDVVADVAEIAGLDASGIVPHPQRVLPLYWTEKGHDGLLDYLAELMDQLWMVRAGVVTFRPYGLRTWAVSTDTGTRPELAPEPRYNTFVQPWRDLSGRLRRSTATADPDPFPGEVRRAPLPDPLEDPQPNNELALAVATARVAYEAAYRASGTVELGELRHRSVPRDPYDIEAGDHLTITDLIPRLGPQRIESVTYRPNDQVSVQVGRTFNMVATLRELERRLRGRRGRRAA